MSKQRELEKIASEIKSCRACKKGKIGLAVPGEGNPNARIIFIGEAPGKTEAETGRPFVGRSGQLLRKLIREVGFKEEEVYITSPVKYLPISGTPSRSDIEHGKIHLWKQISVIKPKILVLLGNTASKAILDEHVPITKVHGQIIKQNDYKLFLTFHPAAAIRFVKFKKLLEKDFLKLRRWSRRA